MEDQGSEGGKKGELWGGVEERRKEKGSPTITYNHRKAIRGGRKGDEAFS